MVINKAYKIRLYPNKVQDQKLLQIAGACRFVWNYYLAKRKEIYEKEKKTLSGYDCAKDLTQLKKQEEYKWLADVPAEALQKSIIDLDTAYKNFFREVKKGNNKSYPQFKSKHKSTPKFYDHMCFKLLDRHLQISLKYGLKMRFRGTRPSENAIQKSITVSQDIDGKWFASILTEQEINPKKKTGEALGIDVGLTHLAITSKGEKIDTFRPAKLLFAKKKKLQQAIKGNVKKDKKSKAKTKGGANWLKAKRLLTNIEKKIRNQRADYLHNTSHRITSENQALIVCEDLSVTNMMKNHKLANSFGDSGIAEFVRQLEYKQIWTGGEFKKVDRFFPSSKICSNCRYKVDLLPLDIREWECPNCHIKHDRDINAAKNLALQAGNLYPCGEAEDSIVERQKGDLAYEPRRLQKP